MNADGTANTFTPETAGPVAGAEPQQTSNTGANALGANAYASPTTSIPSTGPVVNTQTGSNMPGQELLDYPNSQQGQQTTTAQSAGADLLNYGKGGQNNTASSTETESTAVDDNPNTHTPEQMASIEEYKNSVDASMVNYIERVRNGEKLSPYNVTPVTNRAAADILRLTGKTTYGNMVVLDKNGIEHIDKRHGGGKGSADATMKNAEDIARAAYVLNNYDEAHLSTERAKGYVDSSGKPAPIVLFTKKIDGTYVVVETVCDTKTKKNFIISTFLSSAGTSKLKIAKPQQSSNAGTTPDLKANVQDAAGGNSADSSIPNTPQNVNTETGSNMRERGFSQNIRTDENMEAELRRQFEDSPLMYRQLSNADTLAKAQEIYGKGLEEATAELNKWIGEAKAGRKMPPEAIPLSRMIANELTRQGRVQEAVRIESDIAAELTLAGQYAQAARILRDTGSPAAKAKFIKGLAKRLSDDLSDKQRAKNVKRGLGDEEGNIKVDSALIAEYANAQTDDASNAAIDKINQNIANQMPATLMEKINALRYMNMLGNLKTQERNIGGNAAMLAATMAKRRTQAAIESLASAATGGKVERTTSFGINKDLYKAGIEDANAIMDTLQGDAKYSDSRRVAIKGIQDRRRIFDSKLLEGYRKATNWAMEAGDRIFLRLTYADAFQGYLSAHGIKDISEVSPELLNSARVFAIKEAQEATFRDSNKIADRVSSIGRGKNATIGEKILSEGTAPFRKTPANVGIRAVEYSPLGVS